MWDLWWSLLLRSAIILGTAEVLRYSARRCAAADRHRLLVVAFLFVLLWPVLSAVLPVMAVAVPSEIAGGIVTIEQTTTGLMTQKSTGSVSEWALAAWLAGAVLALAPMVVSRRHVRRIVSCASALEQEKWQQLLAGECSRLRIARKPKLLVYPGSIVPFTFGIWHTGVVLPAGCADWTTLRCRAVLVHELAHIARRDLFWQSLAHVVTALWWFQPLCWFARSRLRWESEQACDATVVQSGILASDYAGELLAILQQVRGGQQWSSGALAMARRGELKKRLRTVLCPPTAQNRRLAVVTMLVLAAFAWASSALTIFPEPSSEFGGNTMRHTLLSGLLVSAGLSVATLTGAAANAVAAATDKGTHAADTQSEKPKTVRIGGEVAQANLVQKVPPVYPASAKAAGVQGTVMLDVTISPEGVPEDIHVISSPSDDLSESATEAVRQWRYRPTLLNGEPVTVVTEVRVTYTLAK